MPIPSFDTTGMDVAKYDPYGKGIPGLDTSAYSMDAIQSKPKKDFGFSDIVKLLGIGAGVAGDVIRSSRGEAPTFSRMAGPGLVDYFNSSDPNKASDVAGILKAITDNYSRYSRGTNPFG
jgi:hypothetical protein